MRRKVKLTESQLNSIIKKSVRKVLRESNHINSDNLYEYLDKFFEYTNMSLEDFAKNVIGWFGYDAFIEFLDRQMQLYDVYYFMEENGELEDDEEDVEEEDY